MISKELLNEVLPFGEINSLISYGLSSDGNILLQYEDIGQALNGKRTQSGGYKWQYQMNLEN